MTDFLVHHPEQNTIKYTDTPGTIEIHSLCETMFLCGEIKKAISKFYAR
jgi:hypothetical protein